MVEVRFDERLVRALEKMGCGYFEVGMYWARGRTSFSLCVFRKVGDDLLACGGDVVFAHADSWEVIARRLCGFDRERQKQFESFEIFCIPG